MIKFFTEIFTNNSIGRLNRRGFIATGLIYIILKYLYFFIVHPEIWKDSEYGVANLQPSGMDQFIIFLIGIPVFFATIGRLRDIGLPWGLVFLSFVALIPIPFIIFIFYASTLVLYFYPGKKDSGASINYTNSSTNWSSRETPKPTAPLPMPDTYWHYKDDTTISFTLGVTLLVNENGIWRYVGSIPQYVNLPKDGTFVEYKIRSYSGEQYVGRFKRRESISPVADELSNIYSDKLIEKTPSQSMSDKPKFDTLSVIDRLSRLEKLRESDSLTEEEFNILKQRIIS